MLWIENDMLIVVFEWVEGGKECVKVYLDVCVLVMDLFEVGICVLLNVLLKDCVEYVIGIEVSFVFQWGGMCLYCGCNMDY